MMQDNKKRKSNDIVHGILKKQQKISLKFNKEDEVKYIKNLEKKYNVLLPERLPVVAVKRLQFKSSYFTYQDIKSSSDVDLFRDSATLYILLGKIINKLEIKDKYSALAVCHLWNRAGNEASAWKSIIIQNRVLNDLNFLQRKILKHETEHLYLENVSASDDLQNDFCKFNSVQSLECFNTDIKFAKKILRACNHLVTLNANLKDQSILQEIHPYVKNINLKNIVLDIENHKIIKTFCDLETLTVKSIDPNCYKSISLFFSIKNLNLAELCVNQDIQSFIECVPNIESLEFMPVYNSLNQTEANNLMIEALKRCPSLRRLVWRMPFKQLYESDSLNKSGTVNSEILQNEKNGCMSSFQKNLEEKTVTHSLKNIALKIYLKSSLPECEVLVYTC